MKYLTEDGKHGERCLPKLTGNEWLVRFCTVGPEHLQPRFPSAGSLRSLSSGFPFLLASLPAPLPFLLPPVICSLHQKRAVAVRPSHSALILLKYGLRWRGPRSAFLPSSRSWWCYLSQGGRACFTARIVLRGQVRKRR